MSGGNFIDHILLIQASLKVLNFKFFLFNVIRKQDLINSSRVTS